MAFFEVACVFGVARLVAIVALTFVARVFILVLGLTVRLALGRCDGLGLIAPCSITLILIDVVIGLVAVPRMMAIGLAVVAPFLFTDLVDTVCILA